MEDVLGVYQRPQAATGVPGRTEQTTGGRGTKAIASTAGATHALRRRVHPQRGMQRVCVL